NFNKPTYSFLDFNYQFYSLYKKERNLKEVYDHNIYEGFVYSKRTETTQIYFYKDSVVDMSNHLKSSTPSYYNFSNTFYTSNSNEFESYNQISYPYDYDEYYYPNNLNYSEKAILTNKKVNELLTRNNPEEIKSILDNFLKVADT